MKISLIALSLALVSSIAHADLAEDHAKNCQSSEVVGQLGKNESCRVVIAPKAIETQGYCFGVLMGSLPCAVTYVAIKEGAYMNLTCGTDPDAPMINEDMLADSLGYNVATLISNSNGNDRVINDNNEYINISNRLVDLKIAESKVDGVTSKTGQVSIALQAAVVSLTNVTCR